VDYLTNARSVFEVSSGVVAAVDYTLYDLDDSQAGAQTDWDARILNYGVDMAEPQSEFLNNAATALRWTVQNNDCDLFGSSGWCVSAQVSQTGRNVEGASEIANDTAGAFTVAKRLDQGYSIGAFVSNAHGLGDVMGVTVTSQNPAYGGFIGYSEHGDGSGLQARVSAGYQSGTATFSRTNILGSEIETSGSAGLETSALSATFGRGYQVEAAALVTPYLGLTMSNAQRLAYSEGAQQEGELDAQFSYDSYKAVQVTAALGFTVDGQVGEKMTYHFGAAVERDLRHDLSEFTLRGDDFGSSSYVSGIAPRENRLNVSAGLGYLVGENSTVTLNGFISQHNKDASVDYKVIAGYLVKF
jgi:hypothetical protein